LHHAATNGLDLKAGFVHVPLIEQPAGALGKAERQTGAAPMPLSVSRAALALIIANTMERM
jgi:hypothetical protein